MLPLLVLVVAALVPWAEAMYDGATNYREIHDAKVSMPNGNYYMQSVKTGLYLQFFRNEAKGVTDSTTLKQKKSVYVQYQKPFHAQSGLRVGIYEGMSISGGNSKCLSSQFGYPKDNVAGGRDVAAVSYACKHPGEGGSVKQYWNFVRCGEDAAVAVSLAQLFGSGVGKGKGKNNSGAIVFHGKGAKSSSKNANASSVSSSPADSSTSRSLAQTSANAAASNSSGDSVAPLASSSNNSTSPPTNASLPTNASAPVDQGSSKAHAKSKQAAHKSQAKHRSRKHPAKKQRANKASHRNTKQHGGKQPISDPHNPGYKYYKYCQEPRHFKDHKCTQKPHRTRRSVMPFGSASESGSHVKYLTRRQHMIAEEHLERRSGGGLVESLLNGGKSGNASNATSAISKWTSSFDETDGLVVGIQKTVKGLIGGPGQVNTSAVTNAGSLLGEDAPLEGTFEQLNLTVLDGKILWDFLDNALTLLSLRKRDELEPTEQQVKGKVEEAKEKLASNLSDPEAGIARLDKRARRHRGRKQHHKKSHAKHHSKRKPKKSSRKSSGSKTSSSLTVCLFAEDHLMDQLPVALSSQVVQSFGSYTSQALKYWTNPYDEEFQWRLIRA